MSELTKDFINKNIPLLGFGAMRFQTAEKEIDMQNLTAMIDHYMANGMNYFDTAYFYHGGKSEVALKHALVGRYPRDSFFLANKLPIWLCQSPEHMRSLFDEQRERCGVDYFDFYLHHGLADDNDKRSIEFGAYEFLKELKASGKVRHLGFSFHGNTESLKKVLSERPELEYVLLQINYWDWTQSAKEHYEIAKSYGKHVMIMEPIRGGGLAQLPKDITKLLKDANPALSESAWALRWCGSIDYENRGVMTVLSGMNNMEQLTENVALFKDFKPLSPEEYAVIDKVVEGLRKYPKIGCTECKYCDCPIDIPIADIIKQYNNFVSRKSVTKFKRLYEQFEKNGGDCADCGKCEAVCPQGLKVVEHLRYIENTYSEL